MADEKNEKEEVILYYNDAFELRRLPPGIEPRRLMYIDGMRWYRLENDTSIIIEKALDQAPEIQKRKTPEAFKTFMQRLETIIVWGNELFGEHDPDTDIPAPPLPPYIKLKEDKKNGR